MGGESKVSSSMDFDNSITLGGLLFFFVDMGMCEESHNCVIDGMHMTTKFVVSY